MLNRFGMAIETDSTRHSPARNMFLQQPLEHRVAQSHSLLCIKRSFISFKACTRGDCTKLSNSDRDVVQTDIKVTKSHSQGECNENFKAMSVTRLRYYGNTWDVFETQVSKSRAVLKPKFQRQHVTWYADKQQYTVIYCNIVNTLYVYRS